MTNPTKQEEREYISKTCVQCDGRGIILQLNPLYIRSKRIKAGISMRQMARDLGFSAPFLSDVEHGKRNPNYKIINYIKNL